MYKPKIILSIIAFTVFLFACILKNNKKEYKNYILTNGVITYVRSAHLTNHGMVKTKYDIKFIGKYGKEHVQRNCDLAAKNYSVNDTLMIYYNPLNPCDPITDKKIER